MQREKLLASTPSTVTPEFKAFVSGAMQAMRHLFFQKVMLGEPFGDVARVEKKFHASLETNYRVGPGPFLTLAQVYWTFKIEVGDLTPEYTQTLLAQLLIETEVELGSVFFPTAGPLSIPVETRREAQTALLHQHAPSFEIDRFIAENPSKATVVRLRMSWWSCVVCSCCGLLGYQAIKTS